jgi:hypothetical protein
MRFAKFLFATLFGVVFFITLFKVLFFMLMAAMVVGGIFLASRAFGYRRYHQHMAWQQQYQQVPPVFAPFAGQQRSPFEQPLNPNWQKRQAAPGRRIEVL